MLRKMTEESKCQTADMTIKMILNETNFFTDYPQKSEELEERTENVYELINMATDYSRKTNHEGAEAIEGFLTESALTSGIDSLKDDEDGVVLMTLHGSKRGYIRGFRSSSIRSQTPDVTGITKLI